MDERVELRRFSKAVFGNRHRLEVLAAIAAGESEFYVQALSTATGIPTSTITAIVRELGSGLVDPLPRTALNAPHFYNRVESPVWDMAAELLTEVQALSQRAAVPRRSRH